MNGEIRLELNDLEEEAIRELIRLCNQKDGTSYDTEPDADFFYLTENPGEEESGVKNSILSALFGYRIGERVDGREVLEISAFTHPALRRQGLFTGNLNSLRDDFRDFRFHFLVKPMKDKESMEKGRLPEDTLQCIRARSLSHLSDELFMSKELPRGIINPEDSLCSNYGEVHFSPYSENTLYLYGLLVYDRFLGQGYGRKLMENLETLPAGPYRRVLLQVSSQNEIALSLYQKMGYQIIERTSSYGLNL